MKFTILGFSQKKLIESKLDVIDALILRYFIDFKDSGKMSKELVGNNIYYWINYEYLKNELPILNISKDRIYRRLKHLCEVRILKHMTKRKGGTFSFYAIGEEYHKLISDSDSTVKIPEGYGKNNGASTVKIPEGYGKNTGTKDSSIKDKSISNSSIKDIIDFLNKKANTKYRYTTRKTKDLIIARIREGFTEKDFFTVIDKKTKEWLGTSMEKYLRPQTLFGNNFESYFNQNISKNNKSESKGTFNNYEQRNYDFDNLEKKLLGWDKKEEE